MKMNFSKDELAMVYQYAAGTKEDTLAGLKEIVPVIRDRQTRDIVENTIPKAGRHPGAGVPAALSLIRSSVYPEAGQFHPAQACRSQGTGEDEKATSQEKRARPGTVIIAFRAAARGLPL